MFPLRVGGRGAENVVADASAAAIVSAKRVYSMTSERREKIRQITNRKSQIANKSQITNANPKPGGSDIGF
jgi:hypothetical protein